MNGLLIGLIIVVLFALFFGGIFYLVCFIISARGWGKYVPDYSTEEPAPPQAESASWQSIMIGGGPMPANYRNAVTVARDGEGIYLKMAAFFRPFHPPLFIPWNAITTVEKKPVIAGHYIAVQVEGLPPLVFFKKLGEAILADWQAIENEGKAS